MVVWKISSNVTLTKILFSLEVLQEIVMIVSDRSLSQSDKKDSPGLLSELYKYGCCYTRSRVGPPRDDSAPKSFQGRESAMMSKLYLAASRISHCSNFHHINKL